MERVARLTGDEHFRLLKDNPSEAARRFFAQPEIADALWVVAGVMRVRGAPYDSPWSRIPKLFFREDAPLEDLMYGRAPAPSCFPATCAGLRADPELSVSIRASSPRRAVRARVLTIRAREALVQPPPAQAAPEWRSIFRGPSADDLMTDLTVDITATAGSLRDAPIVDVPSIAMSTMRGLIKVSVGSSAPAMSRRPMTGPEWPVSVRLQRRMHPRSVTKIDATTGAVIAVPAATFALETYAE